jgi:hypothetical protein
MQKQNHRIALFFLGIFSLLLLHQFIPHLHHQHENEHTNKLISEHIHHHDDPVSVNSNKSILDVIMDTHVHNSVHIETNIVQEKSIKQINVQKDIQASISTDCFNFSLNYCKTEVVKHYHPPYSYFNPYLSVLDSRGPPSLG